MLGRLDDVLEELQIDHGEPNTQQPDNTTVDIFSLPRRNYIYILWMLYQVVFVVFCSFLLRYVQWQ